jgi:phenylpropionate dioxygenase-like ring-hydroxylating dioxygenase large terminal subunit
MNPRLHGGSDVDSRHRCPDHRIGPAAGSLRRGWHCLGLLDEFRDGAPHAVEAFGTKLVVFADSAGSLNVLNAYCPHMGGDLSQGTIKDDAVACPFHDWRWSGNGRCASIPYARRVPPLVRTKAWTTLEGNVSSSSGTIPRATRPRRRW